MTSFGTIYLCIAALCPSHSDPFIALFGKECSSSVGQRTREIGVRMALGAQRSSVYKLILKEAAWLSIVGADPEGQRNHANCGQLLIRLF